jgi:hypothetical protein
MLCLIPRKIDPQRIALGLGDLETRHRATQRDVLRIDTSPNRVAKAFLVIRKRWAATSGSYVQQSSLAQLWRGSSLKRPVEARRLSAGVAVGTSGKRSWQTRWMTADLAQDRFFTVEKTLPTNVVVGATECSGQAAA